MGTNDGIVAALACHAVPLMIDRIEREGVATAFSQDWLDELWPDDPDARTGTGYFRIGTNRDMLFKVEDLNQVEKLTDVVGAHRSKPEYSFFASSTVAIETPELPTLP